MIYGDKQFGQRRFLFPTPTSVPEDIACRTFRIPSDAAWLGLFMGAVSLLMDPENYQQFDGGITPEEAAAAAAGVIEWVYDHAEDGCTTCLLPTGEPIVRIGPGGAVQELTPEGWQTPTGDMTPPEVPARSGGTPQDQMCLAAANAMNTLKILYETISDAWNGGLTNAETLSELLLAIAAIIAAAVALWAAAIIALVIVVWDIIYDTLEYVLADLWDANVDEAVQCILFQCATNDAGVVTFDYDCVIAKLAANTDVTSSLTFDQLRLFGQLVYILQFIGGDGLNLAGATTAITSADCTSCICAVGETVTFENPDCYTLMARTNFAISTLDGGFGNPAPSAKSGNRLSGTGHAVKVRVTVGAVLTSASMEIRWNSANNPSNVYLREITMYSATNTILAQFSSAAGGFTQNTWHTVTVNYAGATACAYLICEGAVEGTGQSGQGNIDNISMVLA